MKRLQKILLTLLVFFLVPAVSFAASTLFPQSGGTGTASIPTLGQVLVGQSNGTYQPQATSTLGITGSGAVSSVFARTGAVVAQTGDYTTSQVPEGTNLYYTAARSLASFITNLAATTSVASITALPTLSLPYSQLTGIPASFAYPFPSNATSTLLTFSGGATIANSLTLSGITGSTQCLHVNSSGVVSGTGTDCGSSGGSVTGVTATYPILSSGGTAPVISTAFGTTTANTYSALNTFNGGLTIGSLTGTINANNGVTYATATSSLSVGSPLTVTGTLGALIGGSNSTINCQTASGSQAGCLSSTDWTTFNNKQSALTFSTGLLNTAGTITNTGVLSNIAGTGIGVSGATGNVTISNTGVTSIVAGTNITVSGSTGAVTINSSGSGSGTVGTGTTGQFPYYAANGTTLTATSSLFLAASGNVGIGTTTPLANFSIQDNFGAPNTQPIFSIASSSGAAQFVVYPDGYIQAGPLVSKDTAFCTNGKLCLGYFGSDNTLSGTNIEEGNYSNGGSAYGGFTALNNLDDSTGSHYAFFGLTSSNYNDPTFGTSQAYPNQMQLVNSDGQIVIQADLNATTTVPSANNIIFDVNGNSTAAEVGRFTPTGLGIGSTTPGSLLALGTTNGINFSTATSTFNSTGGINLASGCYAVAGTCIGGSGGAVSSVSNSDGSLTISPTTASVVASVNLAHSNAFTSSQSIQSTSATAFTVGANGATNPALTIDGSTASSVTGVTIKSAATGGNTSILVTDTAANAPLFIDSKGTGQLTLQSTGAGSVNLAINGASRINANTGNIQFNAAAQTSGPHYLFTGVADTALSASTNNPVMTDNFAQTRTHATGAIAFQTDLDLIPSTNTFAAGVSTNSNITYNSSMLIEGPPLVGARGSVTNGVSLFIQASQLSGIPITNFASTTNLYGLLDYAPEECVNGCAGVAPAYSAAFIDSATSTGNVGVGTSTPTSDLMVENKYGENMPIFTVASSTNSTATSYATIFTAFNNGNVGVGTSTPTAAFVSVAASTTIGTVETGYIGQVSIIAGLENGVTKLFQDIDQWGHLITSGDAPTVTGGTSSVSGNDRNGTVTVTGTALTSVTLNFAHPWLSTPECTVATNSTASVADISSISTTAVTFGFSVGLSSNSLYYICQGHQ